MLGLVVKLVYLGYQPSGCMGGVGGDVRGVLCVCVLVLV